MKADADATKKRGLGESGVAGVVLCWNDADRVLALLGDLTRLAPAPARVVVVDNGSTEGEAERVLSAFPEARLVRLAENRGFAGGVNAGIAVALEDGAEWVWLLNPDLVLPTGALGRLLDAQARHERPGLVAPVLMETDGRVQAYGGGRVNLWTGASRHVTTRDEPLDYLTGACLLVAGSMLREIGLFDERYFFYWEDVDLSFRAREAGWSLVVAEDCEVVHEEGSSLGRWSERRWYLMFRGLGRFLDERAALPRVALCLRLAWHAAAMARHGRSDALRGAWRAVREGRSR